MSSSEEDHNRGIGSSRRARRAASLAAEEDIEDDSEFVEETAQNREVRQRRLVAEIVRRVLLGGNCPVKRSELRKMCAKNRSTGLSTAEVRAEFAELFSQAQEMLSTHLGLELVPLQKYMQSSHGDATKDELILVNKAIDFRKSKYLARVAPQWTRDMFCTLQLALVMLVLESDGLEDSELQRSLCETGLFGDDHEAARESLVDLLDRLVQLRFLDISREKKTTDDRKAVCTYIIGPASVACVTKGELINNFARLAFTGLTREELSPQQQKLLAIFGDHLERSIFVDEF